MDLLQIFIHVRKNESSYVDLKQLPALKHLEPEMDGAEKVHHEQDQVTDTLETDVVILGAGMAGIAAARKLKEFPDFKERLLILEGGDRIGGRIKHVPFGGINVEVGANWVHFSNMNPSNVNPVDKLVLNSGLNYIVDDYSDVIFRYRGECTRTL